MKLRFKKNNDTWMTTKILLMKIAVIATMSSLVLGAKLALAVLPNVELVTFFYVTFCIFFPWEVAFGIINCGCALNMLYFGIADWSIMYFFIFNIYGIITFFLRSLILKHWWIMIILTAIMGYIFGAFFFIEQIFLFNFSVALTTWINGFIFDLIHGTSNAILTVIIYPLIYKVMEIMYEQWNYLFNKSFKKNIIKKEKTINN